MRKLFRDRRGVAAIEYALIAALIGVIAVAGLSTVSRDINKTFAVISSKL